MFRAKEVVCCLCSEIVSKGWESEICVNNFDWKDTLAFSREEASYVYLNFANMFFTHAWDRFCLFMERELMGLMRDGNTFFSWISSDVGNI